MTVSVCVCVCLSTIISSDLPFLYLNILLRGFPGLFMVTSQHICFLLFTFFLFLHFLVVGSVRQIKPTHVDFRAHVKIASRIVSYRIVTARPIFTKFLCMLPMAVVRSSSGGIGFIDDVILAHKPRQLNVAAQLIEAQPTCSLGLGYKWRVGIPVAGHWTRGPTFWAPRSGPTRQQWAC